MIIRAFVVLAVAGCSNAGPRADLAFEISGHLEDATISEASGLARSQRQSDRLWIINDNLAKELVHAIDGTGTRVGEFFLQESRNHDWEDLASFRIDDTPYLMVADIGDNHASRDHGTLYFTEEPAASDKKRSQVAWRTDFRYPDGPRDSESAAVDIENGKVLILSKRDLPPQLYELPLRKQPRHFVTATRLGAINSLPRPTQRERDLSPPLQDWYWQPLGMDISQDNRAAVVVTYRAVFYYERRPGQSWFDALNSTPLRISLGGFQNAESIAFGDNERTVFVTGENVHSAVLRIDLAGVPSR